MMRETRICAREGCQNEFEITPRKKRKRFCSRYCTVHEPCIDCGSLAKKSKGRPTRCVSCGCKNQRKYTQEKICQICTKPFVCSSSGDKRCANCLAHRYTGLCIDCDKYVTNQNERCHKCAMRVRKENGMSGMPKKYCDVVYPCDYCGKDFEIDGASYRSRSKSQDNFYCSSECGYADKRDIFGRSAAQRHRIYHRAVQPIGMNRSTMLNSNDGVCWYCLQNPSTDLHHVRSRARGGTDHWTNLFPLCEECHYGAFEGEFEKDYRDKWGRGWNEGTVERNMHQHKPLKEWFAQDSRLDEYYNNDSIRLDPDAVAPMERYYKQRKEWEKQRKEWEDLIQARQENTKKIRT